MTAKLASFLGTFFDTLPPLFRPFPVGRFGIGIRGVLIYILLASLRHFFDPPPPRFGVRFRRLPDRTPRNGSDPPIPGGPTLGMGWLHPPSRSQPPHRRTEGYQSRPVRSKQVASLSRSLKDRNKSKICNPNLWDPPKLGTRRVPVLGAKPRSWVGQPVGQGGGLPEVRFQGCSKPGYPGPDPPSRGVRPPIPGV